MFRYINSCLILLAPLLLTSILAGAQPWHRSNKDELGRNLSSRAKLILPEDKLWAVSIERWTTWSQPIVVASIEAATVKDVQLTVQYANTHSLPLLVKNSGHGFTKTLEESIRPEQNGIQLSLKGLDNVRVDTKKNTVTVGGGVKNWQVADAVFAAKKRTPIGACDCVGYLGAGLGGGHGRMQGLHGLIADNLLEASLVTADGQLLTVSEKEHSELFWALRGAGHNYGVVVSATFRIYDPIDNSNWINADYHYDASQIPVVISHINRFRSIQPATMTIFFYFGPDMGSPVIETAPPILHVSVQYGGPPDKFPELVRPFAIEFKPFKSTNATTPWNQVNRYNQAGKDTGLCMSGTRKAMFSELLKTYDVNDMVASYEFLKKMREENPQLARSVMLFESYPLQAFKRVKNEDTAYPHRDMNIITGFLVETTTPTTETAMGEKSPDDPAIKLLGEEGRRILKRSPPNNDPERVYVNYAYGDEGARSMYWGAETWRMMKLQRLKLKWDPEAMFSRYNPVWP